MTPGANFFHRCLLVHVDLEVTRLRAIGAQPGRELGADFAPERRIQDMQVEASACHDRHPHVVFNALRAHGSAGELYAGLCQLLSGLRTRGLLPGSSVSPRDSVRQSGTQRAGRTSIGLVLLGF